MLRSDRRRRPDAEVGAVIGCEIRFGRRKRFVHRNCIVQLIRHVNAAAGPHRKTFWSIELAPILPPRSPGLQVTSVWREDLYAMVIGVAYEDSSRVFDIDPTGTDEPAGPITGCSPRSQKPTRGVERLDAIVKCIRNIDDSRFTDGDPAWISELPVHRAGAAPSKQHRPVGVEHLNPVLNVSAA